LRIATVYVRNDNVKAGATGCARSGLAIHPAAVPADNEITLTCENLRDVIGCQLGATQRNIGIGTQLVALATPLCNKVIYGNSMIPMLQIPIRSPKLSVPHAGPKSRLSRKRLDVERGRGGENGVAEYRVICSRCCRVANENPRPKPHRLWNLAGSPSRSDHFVQGPLLVRHSAGQS
jgi:hypothetical protein